MFKPFIFVPPSIDKIKILNIDTKYIKTNRGYRIPFLIVHGEHNNSNDSKLIVYSHGNKSDIYTDLSFINAIKDITGCSILAYDYCGYGIHQLDDSIEITEENMVQDLQSIIDYIICNNNMPIKNIFLLGKSLGTGPSIKIASCLPSLGGVILITPFLSIGAIIAGKDINFIEGVDMFNNKKNIVNIGCPIFLTHCKNDINVPFKHAQILYQSAIINYLNVYTFWEGSEDDSGSSGSGGSSSGVTKKMIEMIATFIHSN